MNAVISHFAMVVVGFVFLRWHQYIGKIVEEAIQRSNLPLNQKIELGIVWAWFHLGFIIVGGLILGGAGLWLLIVDIVDILTIVRG